MYFVLILYSLTIFVEGLFFRGEGPFLLLLKTMPRRVKAMQIERRPSILHIPTTA